MKTMSLDMKKVLKRLADADQMINFQEPPHLTEDQKSYLNYYGFRLRKVTYSSGKMTVNGIRIMVQMFSPESCTGTVILIHGYLDHVGILKNMIEFLTDHKFRVIGYDLQGHGLSEGEKASVKNFSEYVTTLESLMKRIREEISGPVYGIGHSTGGAILIDYLLKHKENSPDKVVLIAPLVRSHLWQISKAGVYFLRLFPFVKQIRRNYYPNSSDKQFLSFLKKDPLQFHYIPLDWLQSLILWNREIKAYKPTDTETLIIQGTKDMTVEWNYNIQFIKDKFLHVQIELIRGGKHQLLNEKPEIREHVFQKIAAFLTR
ncbi:alpha/beta hydrolase [Sporolactobacillus sp. THM7-4]|nr:alpha/beta hydrolase [Sporolactobacillus sp. THM7-4]